METQGGVVNGLVFFAKAFQSLNLVSQFKNSKSIGLAEKNASLAVSQSLEFTIRHPYRGNVFNCFYEIKAQSNFLCLNHRVMVNGFEPMRARIVYCLVHKIIYYRPPKANLTMGTSISWWNIMFVAWTNVPSCADI